MRRLTPRNFGLLVTSVTPLKNGVLLTTPFTRSDGSVVTLLAKEKRGTTELSDWGMTADHLLRNGKRWDEVLSKMALRHLVHGRTKVDGREIISTAKTKDAPRHIGAMVQTILTLDSVILLAPDAEDEEFTRKVEKIIRRELGETHEIIPGWYDAGHDPHKAFAVDYRVNGASPPVHFYVIGAASKISRVTATSLFFKSLNIQVPSIVVVNPDISPGARQKERLQVAADRIVWNIDRQGATLPEIVKNPRPAN